MTETHPTTEGMAFGVRIAAQALRAQLVTVTCSTIPDPTSPPRPARVEDVYALAQACDLLARQVQILAEAVEQLAGDRSEAR